MTGYASGTGEIGVWKWTADLRSLNGRGLDIRLRIPDWIEGLEPKLREMLRNKIARGSVTLSIRLSREDGDVEALQIDAAQLDAALNAVSRIEVEAAEAHGLSLASSRATDVLALCRQSALASGGAAAQAKALVAPLCEQAASLLVEFDVARAAEGAKLAEIITGQLDQIATLTQSASKAATERASDMAETLQANLARVLDNVQGGDPDRVAQELALLAVKADVTEELDRLTAHVAQARDQLAVNGPVGRKLDFLTQEFNREANTLCSKSQSLALTRIGLDLKAVIDQMREQVQNVE